MLDTPEPLRNLADLIAAQLEYHKKAYEILSELAPVVDGLQVEQEVGAEAVGAIIMTLMCESRPAIGRAGNRLEGHASWFKRAFRVLVLLSLPSSSNFLLRCALGNPECRRDEDDMFQSIVLFYAKCVRRPPDS